MVVVLKYLLAVAVVGVCTDASRVRVDISQAANENQSGAQPVAESWGKVQICKETFHPHTYINLGDGGCFQHLQRPSGHFIDDENKRLYTVKHCPFAGHEPEHITARKLFLKWWTLSIGGYPPWAINDLAMSCMTMDPVSSPTFGDSLPETFLESLDVRSPGSGDDDTKPIITKGRFCDMMLSLPLMFEAIGFDGPGLVMEDKRTNALWTFQGEEVQQGGARYSQAADDCSWRSNNLGTSPYARLALRAILPTYFRHRYAQSGTGMMVKGLREIFSYKTEFEKSYWQDQVKKVCETAGDSPMELDELFSLQNLGAEKQLLSEEVMARDSGNCHSADPCNYPVDETNHLHSCDVCADGEKPDDKENPNVKRYLWFHKPNGGCYNANWFGNLEYCEKPQVKAGKGNTCACHKAICWYFTNDFRAALKVAAEECPTLLAGR